MLTEGVGQRRLALRRPRLGQALGTLEKLTVIIDQREQGDGRMQEACGQPGETVERLFGRGVEQPEPEQLVETSRIKHCTLEPRIHVSQLLARGLGCLAVFWRETVPSDRTGRDFQLTTSPTHGIGWAVVGDGALDRWRRRGGPLRRAAEYCHLRPEAEVADRDSMNSVLEWLVFIGSAANFALINEEC